ncbi:MAG TPA: hypothetical protein PLN48_01330 [Lachnospiraceae bacterium]|nr:hypothetical protein [Lachnospiraceae bacterium]
MKLTGWLFTILLGIGVIAVFVLYTLNSHSTKDVTYDPTESEWKAENFVIIGDGRTQDLQQYADSQVHFVCQPGADLTWMNTTGIPSSTSMMDKETAVIVMLGISDLKDADGYISSLNGWADKIGETYKAHLYFVSVNPVGDGIFTNNSEIEKFNSALKTGLSSDVTYTDTYSVLLTQGYSTTDSLHYTADTSNMLYHTLMNLILDV